MRNLATSFLIILTFISCAHGYSSKEISEAKQRIIQQSKASYSGNCPCPEDRASNGYRCGKRSAYSRAGGANPKCYESDVSDTEAIEFMKRRS